MPHSLLQTREQPDFCALPKARSGVCFCSTLATESRKDGARGCLREMARPWLWRMDCYMPSLPQISSTLALVARSISIMGGHWRSKPSAFHFRVASMPIFEP